MELQKSDYQRLARLTRKELNTIPIDSPRFQETRNLFDKVESKVKEFGLHGVIDQRELLINVLNFAQNHSGTPLRIRSEEIADNYIKSMLGKRIDSGNFYCKVSDPNDNLYRGEEHKCHQQCSFCKAIEMEHSFS